MTTEHEGKEAEIAVNAYRIEQLETQLEDLRAATKTLNFEQIKQMGLWLGLPVAIATGVFGLALWQTIEIGTTSAAEARASETVNDLTSDIEALESSFQDLQDDSEEAFRGLIAIRAGADESARFVRRQADNAEARANDAARALAELQRTAATATDIQQALGDVDEIANRVARNGSFQKLVSDRALAGLEGMVVAFDQSGGCPAGWSMYEDAAGRVVIGVGEGSIDRIGDQDIPLTERRWRETGGAEMVSLTNTQIPAHSHSLNLDTKSHKFDQYGSKFIRFNVTTGGTTTAALSDNKPSNAHENMPPYIALYFCKKQG